MAEQRTAHALDLLSSFENLRAKNMLCDFKIKTGGEILHVHRTVLAACSDYFQAMFTSNLKEVQEGIVEMKDVEADAVKKCIDFMYTGQANVTIENVLDIIHTSTMMQLNKYSEYCFSFLGQNLTTENWSSIKALTNLYGSKEITKIVDEYALSNFEALIYSENFHMIETADLCQYLSLAEESGSIIWEAVRKWISYDPKQRRKSFLSLVKSIKFDRFTEDFFRQNVLMEPLLKNSQDCQDFLQNVLSKIRFKPPRIAVLNPQIGLIDALDVSTEQWQFYGPAEKSDCMRMIGFKGDLYLLSGNKFMCMSKDGRWTKEVEIRHTYQPQHRWVQLVIFQDCIYLLEWDKISCFDPKQSTWLDFQEYPEKHMYTPGFFATATQQFIYNIGRRGFPKLAFQYNPVARTCSETAPMNRSHGYGCAATLNGFVFVMGGCHGGTGNIAEMYDEATNTWTEIANMQRHRTEFSACVMDGKICAVGGNYDPENQEIVEDSIEVYKPKTNQWRIVKKLRKVPGPVLACIF